VTAENEMSQNRANNYTQLVSVAAVLIGLAFVAYELKQNNSMMRAQIRNELSAASIELNMMWQRPELVSLYLKTSSSADNLSAEEARLLSLAIGATFRMWENMHYQNRIGTYDESEIAANRLIWSNSVKSIQVYREYWSQSKQVFSEEFQNEIDTIIGE